MFRQINWQLILVILIAIISIGLIIPTARYFTFMATTPAPAPGSPEEKQYDEKVMALKKSSITPGLDLQGGVDILMAIDHEKTELDQLAHRMAQLKQLFRNNSLDATVDVDNKARAIDLKILNTKDFRQAKNLLDQMKGAFADFDITPLSEGKPIALKLSTQEMSNYFEQSISGSEKVLRNRVDEFGLTQATVVRQAGNRIRIQIPGEKDPQRVITNMLKPAKLEFRLMADDSFEKAPQLVEEKEENGKTVRTVKTDQVPPGYRVFWGEVVERNPQRIGTKTKKTIPYLLKDTVELTGEFLTETYVEVVESDLDSPIHINLVFDRNGARIFRDLTEKNRGKNLAILLDNIVYTAPRIKEAIPNGRCYISGSFDMDEAREVSQVLKAGSMPARLYVEHKQTVGASLGTDTIKASVNALLIGSALVIAFMIIYYGTAGLLADIALILNVLLILAVMAMARASLTLSGIGGILLTVGMGVDANVLIFERIREELAAGKPLKLAVKQGFERAFIVIWDSNFTTLITALILLQFATGSVRGFALTMTIGLIVNLYTGYSVTRSLTELWISWRNKLSVGVLTIFKNPRLKVIEYRYVAYAISGSLILVSIIALIIHRGPIYAVDFEGGMLAQVQFKEKISGESIYSAFSKAGGPAVRVQRVTGTNEFLLRMKFIENDGVKTETFIKDTLKTGFGEGKFEIRAVQQVGNEIGGEFRRIALTSVGIASLAILVYVAFRFQFVFGVTAVIALIHDIFITLGVLTLTGREMSLDVLSALLMILGYSINDTIVIFDRIRENIRIVPGKNFKEIANLSINQSLNRTLLTSGTTIVPMFIMFLIGGKGLQDFCFTLCFGFVIGVYSTDFVATPLAYEWLKRKGFKTAEEVSRKKTHYELVEPLS